MTIIPDTARTVFFQLPSCAVPAGAGERGALCAQCGGQKHTEAVTGSKLARDRAQSGGQRCESTFRSCQRSWWPLFTRSKHFPTSYFTPSCNVPGRQVGVHPLCSLHGWHGLGSQGQCPSACPVCFPGLCRSCVGSCSSLCLARWLRQLLSKMQRGSKSCRGQQATLGCLRSQSLEPEQGPAGGRGMSGAWGTKGLRLPGTQPR